MTALLILGCAASALLLIYALHLIALAEYRERVNQEALDAAIAAKWTTGMSPEQLAELDRYMWRG